MTEQNFTSPPPFATKVPTPPPTPTPVEEKPTLVPDAPVDETPVVAPPVTPDTKKKINKESIDFVKKNIKTMSYISLSEVTGLTKHQINRILQDIKKGLRKAVTNNDGMEAYGIRMTAGRKAKGDKPAIEPKEAPNYTKPISEYALKVEAWIDLNLTRPAETKKAANNAGSEVKTALGEEVQSILDSL